MAIKTQIQLRRDTLANWQSANPILAQGEVALVDKNNSTNFSNPLWVLRIGDGTKNFNDLPETAYLLRSELEDVSQGLADLSNITGVIGGGGLSAAISSVSSAVSSIGDGLSAAISSVSSAVSSLYLSSSAISSAVSSLYLSSTAISTEVHNKVKIEGTATDYIDVRRVNAETYHDLINGGTIDQKTIYIVSSDNINAFGERVINVGDALNLSDAVNLKQLSTVSADIMSKSSGGISSVSAAVSSVSAAVSSLYLSSTAISSAVDFLSSQISSIDDDYSVEVSSLGRTGDTYKYAIMQGGESKGQIEVPYDVFVNNGEIQTIDGKKYLLLTLNNQTSTVLSIETTDLVDVYTGLSTDTISVNVDQYKIEAIVNSNSIDTAHIKDNAVTTAKILDSNVTEAKLATDSVTTVKIKDSNVTTAKIADDAVTTAKILDSNVTTAKIADNAVTTGKILDAAVTPDKLDPNGVFVFDCGNASASA